MVKLKADFESDWIAHLRSHMAREWGPTVACINDRNIPAYFCDSLRRRIASRRRKLKISDDFQCPAGEEAGWRALQDKIRKGKDLNPHLSKRHAALLNRDGLLAEWEVHHLHLGTKPDPADPYYIGRTSSLVFALIDDTTFYAIGVYKHGDWEETRILESIHRNWPDMVSVYRANSMTGETLTKKQRRATRKKNANVLTRTTDGTDYLPFGGVVASKGVKMEAVRCADIWRAEIQHLQFSMENKLRELIPVFEKEGYAGEEELDAELRITEAGYQVFFPRYSILANIFDEPA